MPATDDFKLIPGIGPATESLLHGAGIRTFAQLGELTAADVGAVVPNLSGKRHRLSDWIAEAKRRASPRSSAWSGEPGVDATDSQLRVQALEVLPGQQSGEQNGLEEGQPFKVRVSLDLTGLHSLGNGSQVGYSLTICANGLRNGNRRILADDRGAVTRTGDVVALEVDAEPLAADLYRFTAFVALGRLAAGGPSSSWFRASTCTEPIWVS
jgi:hypothetical protein